LYKFPEVFETADLRYQPHLICNFLFDLAQKFNSFYNNVPILNTQKTRRIGESENSEGQAVRKSDGLNIRDTEYSESSEKVTNFRLALTFATSQVLKNGLYLLGIEAPERM
jgi:arginyl-tRNA synthetase